MIGAFAVLALVLVAFGLHATIAYSVGQRTRELGIRVALGAQTHDVMELVIGQGIKLTAAGMIVGVVGGIVAGRTMRAPVSRRSDRPPHDCRRRASSLPPSRSSLLTPPPAARQSVDPAETLRAE